MAEPYSTLMGAKKAAETAALQRKKLLEQAQYDQWRGSPQAAARQQAQEIASLGVGQTPGSTFRKIGPTGQLYWGKNTGEPYNPGLSGQSLADEYERRLQSAMAEQQQRYLSQQNQLQGSYNDWAKQYGNTLQSQYQKEYNAKLRAALENQGSGMAAGYKSQAAGQQSAHDQEITYLMSIMTPDQINTYAKSKGQQLIVVPAADGTTGMTFRIAKPGELPQGAIPYDQWDKKPFGVMAPIGSPSHQGGDGAYQSYVAGTGQARDPGAVYTNPTNTGRTSQGPGGVTIQQEPTSPPIAREPQGPATPTGTTVPSIMGGGSGEPTGGGGNPTIMGGGTLINDYLSARDQYLSLYPDVAKAGVDPWTHYTMYGQKEGRQWPGQTLNDYMIGFNQAVAP